MKVGDLVYWHENAWLMSQGIKPKVVHGVIIKEYEKSNTAIWHVVRCDNGKKGIVHESDLRGAVRHESRRFGGS